ncbi:MAG: hypothetical protein ACRCWI_01610 [Brevinema sp.]
MKQKICVFILFAFSTCSITSEKTTPNSYYPSFVHPNIIFTQALFKTNFSGVYTAKNNALIEVGQHLLNFQDGYSIETSLINHEMFVFNIIYTNHTLIKGVKKIIFTNGVWDGYANFHTLEISSPSKGFLNNLLVYYIEEPSKAYLWKASIQIQDSNLFFMGTNIAVKTQ